MLVTSNFVLLCRARGPKNVCKLGHQWAREVSCDLLLNFGTRPAISGMAEASDFKFCMHM